MEITVECNKLFIQDLPAGGSFSLFFICFFQAKQQLSSHAFLPFKMCLIRISTTNPVFQFVCWQDLYSIAVVAETVAYSWVFARLPCRQVYGKGSPPNGK